MPTKKAQLDKAYKQAKKAGKGDAFLASHSNYAKNIGADVPISGNKSGGLSKVKKPVRKKLKGEMQAADVQAQQQIKYFNPQYNTAFGSSQVTYDEEGNPIYTEALSEPQQQILNAGQAITQTGQNLAQQGLANYQQFNPGDFLAKRQEIEDQVFNRLTRDLDQNYGDRKAQLEQTLYNRGIPLDPENPQYQKHMKAIDDQYNRAREEARQTAIATGGQELSRQFGLEQGTHQQQLSDVGFLQQQGTGFVNPNLPGYQAPQYNLPSPTELDLAYKQLQMQQREHELAMQKLGRGGGGGAAPAEQAPAGPTFLS